MKVIKEKDLYSFIARQKKILQEYEEKNCLAATLLERLKANLFTFSPEKPLFLSLCNKEGVSVGFAIQTPPHNLILSHPLSKEAQKILINFIKEEQIILPGLMAPKKQAQEFIQEWRKVFSQKDELRMQQRLYKLSAVFLPPLEINEKFILAQKNHLELILEWTYCFIKEVVEKSLKEDRKTFFSKNERLIEDALQEGQYYFLTKDNTEVAMARTPGRTSSGRLINYVYTPKEQRKKGYATRCVAHLSQEILNQGYQKCFLFTDLSNPTSNSIYKKIGYQEVEDFNLYKFLTEE